MPRDDAQLQGDLMTAVTIIQLRAELLRRHLRRHDLARVDKEWIERDLDTLVAATRELTSLVTDTGSETPEPIHGPIPSLRLVALDRLPRN